jgi:hypothetical protein
VQRGDALDRLRGRRGNHPQAKNGQAGSGRLVHGLFPAQKFICGVTEFADRFSLSENT